MRKRKKGCNCIIGLILLLLFSISIGYSALSSTLSMSGEVTVSAPPTTYPVSYAVQIYGINEDVDANGDTLGLTFGPATGDNYNNKYVTHRYEETSSGSGVYNVIIQTHTVAANGDETTTEEVLINSASENVTRTEVEKNKYDINLHDMTWTEISDVSDKTEFLDCMLCGDTKKVELNLNETIGSGTIPTQYGDGAGMLYGVINQYFRMWNPSSNSTDYPERNNSAVGTGITLDWREILYGPNARNAGGYSVSHIRATLIGENSETNIGYAGDVNLSGATSLYSCLPRSLKNVITAKKVRYVTGNSYINGRYSLNEDIADKIWILSDREMFGTGSYSGTNAEGLGTDGHGYGRFSNTDSKYYIASYNDNDAIQRVCYNEVGSAYYWWLRTPYLSDTIFVHNIGTNGYLTDSSDTYSTFALNFGFCIK